MKKENDIISEAKEAYEKTFKDINELSLEKENDVFFNQSKIVEDIKEKKEKQINKAHSLKVLEEQIIIEAEDSYKKAFKENEKKKNTFNDYTEEKYQKENINWGKQLKNK